MGDDTLPEGGPNNKRPHPSGLGMTVLWAFEMSRSECPQAASAPGSASSSAVRSGIVPATPSSVTRNSSGVIG